MKKSNENCIGEDTINSDEKGESSTMTNCSYVQIKANKKELERRILAFMTRKRKEADELNLQEFCNLPRAEMASEFSCARVDAVVVHRDGSKGHVKVSRVVNQWGPQTVPTALSTNQLTNNNEAVSSGLPDSFEERLNNMEIHLNLKAGKPVPRSIYERLRNLEDRILFLESLSPDYFFETPRKILKTGPDIKNVRINKKEMTVEEIDARIEELQSSLLKQSSTSHIK